MTALEKEVVDMIPSRLCENLVLRFRITMMPRAKKLSSMVSNIGGMVSRHFVAWYVNSTSTSCYNFFTNDVQPILSTVYKSTQTSYTSVKCYQGCTQKRFGNIQFLMVVPCPRIKQSLPKGQDIFVTRGTLVIVVIYHQRYTILCTILSKEDTLVFLLFIGRPSMHFCTIYL